MVHGCPRTAFSTEKTLFSRVPGAKGVEQPVVLFEVLGIGGRHKLSLAETADMLVELKDEIPFLYEVVESSQVGGALSKAVLTRVSLKAADARLANPVQPLSNLKMHFIGSDGTQNPGSIYAKVLGPVPGTTAGVSIRFTSVPPEINEFLKRVTADQAS